MPLFPYLPVIVWMGVLKIVLGGRNTMRDRAQMIPPTGRRNGSEFSLFLPL